VQVNEKAGDFRSDLSLTNEVLYQLSYCG
jgi:hypothetical protein